MKCAKCKKEFQIPWWEHLVGILMISPTVTCDTCRRKSNT